MKQLKTEIIALCDYASVSREGKLSINGIFDELRVAQFPGGIARAFLVATINGTPSTQYKLNLKVESKGGGKSPVDSLALDTITAPNGKNNLVIELVNLGFEKEGDYLFKIYNREEEVGSTLLKVFDQKKYSLSDIKLPN
ncbi:MAG: hypothetical protein AAB609_02080 [Patescibacteria group bacterium]